MSQLTEHIGFEIARAALAHLPPEVRAPLLHVLGPPITALFDALFELLGAGDDEASQQALLGPLLASGGTLPPGEAFLDAELPLTQTATPGATRLAQQCGRLFGPTVRGLLLTQGGVQGADQEEDEGGSAGEDAAQPATPQDREERWRQILDELGHGHLVAELKTAGAFEEVDPVPEEPIATAAGLFTRNKVIRMLQALVAVLGKLFPEFLAEAQRLLAAGLEDAARRTAVAGALTLAAKRARMAKSDFKIGNKVHRVLQNLYVTDHRLHHDLVVERYNRAIRRAEAVVVGPSTKGLRRSFSYVFKNNLDRDFFFRALQLALATPKLEIDSRLRADLINVTRGSIWEIKPVASAVAGVWQETMYRLSFNIVRRFLLFASKLPAHRPASLESGSAWLGITSAWTKVDPATPFLFTLSPIFVTTDANQPAVAVPFQLSMLPGLVPYLVVSPETLRKWVEAVRKLAEAAKQKALEILSKMVDALRPIAEGVLEVLQAILAVVLVIFLIIFALFTGAGRIPALQPGVAPGTIQPGSPREGFGGMASVMDGLLYIPWSGRQGNGGAAPRADEADRTDVNFGSVVVGNVPVKALEPFLAAVRTNFDALIDRSIVTMDRRAAALRAPAGVA